MNPFTALTSKIFASLAGGLLIVLVILWFQLRGANAEVDRQKQAVQTCEAARAVQNEAIRAAQAEGEKARQAFTTAVESGQRAIAEAQGRVRVVRQTAPNGCATPSSIREAGL